MEPQHELSELFLQLGMAGDAASIDRFITDHRPLDGNVALAEATFWSTSQAAFLSEEIARDAEWAELVDRLNEMLRS